MELKKLEYLIKVSELGSITEAAKQLYITQPALSQVISAMEKKYGVPIFERKEGGLVLTYGGKLLIDAGRRQLLIEESLKQELLDVKNEEAGTLKIGISVNRAAHFLPVALPEWRRRFPKIQLQVDTHSYLGFEKLVTEGKLDMAFVMKEADVSVKTKKELIYEPLFQYNCLLVVPPNHPLAEETGGILDWRLRPPVDLNRVRDEPFITTPIKQRTAKWLNSIYEAYNFYPKSVVIINGASQYNLVQAGIGCALLQDPVAFAQKRGAFFRLDKGDFATTLCIIRKKNAYETKAMKYFTELIKEYAKQGKWAQL